MQNQTQNDEAKAKWLEDHKQSRHVFRILGWVFLGVGLICEAIGLISMASMMDGATSNLFFFCWIGGPFLFAAFLFLSLGYMGAMARYSAGEQAPVMKDTSNYIIDGTRDETVKTVAAVVKEVKNDDTSAPVCPKCGVKNEVGAKFCDHCGAPLSKVCPKCGENNDGDSTFCRKCGERLS
jgi:ribosomal protein L40E